jgi:hypothetical protein
LLVVDIWDIDVKVGVAEWGEVWLYKVNLSIYGKLLSNTLFAQLDSRSLASIIVSGLQIIASQPYDSPSFAPQINLTQVADSDHYNNCQRLLKQSSVRARQQFLNMPPQIKQDLNRSGWETTDFPSVCENCLPDNPYVQMIKQDAGEQCKVML